MNEEEKLVKIDPLPEEEKKEQVETDIPEVKEKPKKKRGRKPNPNKKEKTGEKHVMTDARKRALLKARLAKAEKRKQRLAEQEKALKQAEGKETEAQMPVQKSEHQDAVLHRLGALEQSLTSLTTSMSQLMNSGVFSGSEKQAEQTTPQIPTELRQADFGRQEESFVRSSNGGESYNEVNPNPTDRRLTQKDRPIQKRTRSARVENFSF